MNRQNVNTLQGQDAAGKPSVVTSDGRHHTDASLMSDIVVLNTMTLSSSASEVVVDHVDVSSEFAQSDDADSWYRLDVMAKGSDGEGPGDPDVLEQPPHLRFTAETEGEQSADEQDAAAQQPEPLEQPDQRRNVTTALEAALAELTEGPPIVVAPPESQTEPQTDGAIVDVEEDGLESPPERSVVPAAVADWDGSTQPSDGMAEEETAEELVEDVPTVASEPDAGPLAATWEVDELRWSDTCDELFEVSGEYLEQAGKKLCAAAADGLRALAVCSTHRGEGRTTLTLALAKAAAAAGLRVALLDADCANPQLAAQLGVETICSWHEVLDDRAPLPDAAVSSVADKVVLFPLAAPEMGQSVFLNDPRVTKLVRRISRHFELVIVDMGPVTRDEASFFEVSSECPVDAVMVAHDVRCADHTGLEATVARLRSYGIQGIGVAQNFVPATTAVA